MKAELGDYSYFVYSHDFCLMMWLNGVGKKIKRLIMYFDCAHGWIESNIHDYNFYIFNEKIQWGYVVFWYYSILAVGLIEISQKIKNIASNAFLWTWFYVMTRKTLITWQNVLVEKYQFVSLLFLTFVFPIIKPFEL